MASKDTKSCLASPANREMHVETTRYYYIPIKIA